VRALLGRGAERDVVLEAIELARAAGAPLEAALLGAQTLVVPARPRRLGRLIACRAPWTTIVVQPGRADAERPRSSPHEPVPLRTIVVATDGSGPSRAAIASALTLAARSGAEVVSLLVLPGSEPEASAALFEAAEAAEEWPVRHRVEAVEGDPISVIVGRAAELDADLVVVGSHGPAGRLGRALGRISELVAERAGRPVLVVRASWQADAEPNRVPAWCA
jgi:nucleotide-binding universal stress UspA family protein